MSWGIVEALIDEGVSDAEIAHFLEVYGGLPLYIPKNYDERHPIAAECGPRLAEALSRIYGGTQPVVPTGVEFKRRQDREKVVALKMNGENNHEIARRTGLHLRQVYRIVASMDRVLIPPRHDPNQQFLPIE